MQTACLDYGLSSPLFSSLLGPHCMHILVCMYVRLFVCMYECLYVCLHIVVNVCLKGWGCARISVSPYVCVCLHMRVSSMSMHMLAHACLKHV